MAVLEDFSPSLDLGDDRVRVDPVTRRVAFRIANWDDVHSGFDQKVRMPRNVNVEAAHVGHATLDDGSKVRVATIPMHTTHAPRDMSAMHAASWYEDTGKGVARVRYSTDERGLRADGVLFSDVSEADLERLQAAAPSGDWRSAVAIRRPSDFENAPADLVGASIVSIPGFSGTYSQSEGRRFALAASAFSILSFEDEVGALTAAGSGSQHLHVVDDRQREWDGPAAQQRVKQWATKPDGSIDFERYGQAFLYRDASRPGELGSYKLGFADVINGELMIVPRGVFAAAAAVEGSRGGVDISPDDMATVKRELGGLYAHLRNKFKDESIRVPWEGTQMAASGAAEDCVGTCAGCACSAEERAAAAAGGDATGEQVVDVADGADAEVEAVNDGDALTAAAVQLAEAAAEREVEVGELVASLTAAASADGIHPMDRRLSILEQRVQELEQLVADSILSM